MSYRDFEYRDTAQEWQSQQDDANRRAEAAHREEIEAEQRDQPAALPTFRIASRAPMIATPEPEAPETRMSIAQLRDRISGMEATQDAKRTAAVSLGKKAEKPYQEIARASKLKAYRAELAKREEREIARTAERVRAAAAIDTRAAEIEAERQAERNAHDEHRAHCAAQAPPAPRDEPQKCAEPGCSSHTGGAKLCSYHRAARADEASKEQAAARLAAECPACLAQPGARCKNYKGDFCSPHGERRANRRICIHDGCIAWTYQPEPAPALCLEHRDDGPGHPERKELAASIGKAFAQAEREARDAADHARELATATVVEIPPPPAAAQAATDKATEKRRAVVAAAAELSALDIAAESLIRQYTLGSLLDAAWAASARIHPRT